METLIADLVHFSCVVAKTFIFGRDSGHYAKPILNFKIFIEFPHFLRPLVLSCLATHEATHTFQLLVVTI